MLQGRRETGPAGATSVARLSLRAEGLGVSGVRVACVDGSHAHHPSRGVSRGPATSWPWSAHGTAPRLPCRRSFLSIPCRSSGQKMLFGRKRSASSAHSAESRQQATDAGDEFVPPAPVQVVVRAPDGAPTGVGEPLAAQDVLSESPGARRCSSPSYSTATPHHAYRRSGLPRYRPSWSYVRMLISGSGSPARVRSRRSSVSFGDSTPGRTSSKASRTRATPRRPRASWSARSSCATGRSRAATWGDQQPANASPARTRSVSDSSDPHSTHAVTGSSTGRPSTRDIGGRSDGSSPARRSVGSAREAAAPARCVATPGRRGPRPSIAVTWSGSLPSRTHHGTGRPHRPRAVTRENRQSSSMTGSTSRALTARSRGTSSGSGCPSTTYRTPRCGAARSGPRSRPMPRPARWASSTAKGRSASGRGTTMRGTRRECPPERDPHLLMSSPGDRREYIGSGDQTTPRPSGQKMLLNDPRRAPSAHSAEEASG